MELTDVLLDRMIAFIPVLLSLTVHEWAHAWTAWRLGDDTAKMMGRVSLNPLDHMDPVGTFLLPLLGVPFGWAKPVPVNPTRFHPNVNMRLGILSVAAAGPISNLILAVLGLIALGAMSHFSAGAVVAPDSATSAAGLIQLLQVFITINILLALFNLLPIPPLDGSQIADSLMPEDLRPYWTQFASLGPLLLAVVILMPAFLGFSLFAWPLTWVHRLLSWVTGGLGVVD